MRVLLIADESPFTSAVVSALQSREHHVGHVRPDIHQLAVTPCDLVLVDLDSGNGTQLCRELRALTGVAMIGLTTRGRERCGMAALREGADDFVVRPVSLAELLARIDAVLRRAHPEPGGEQAVGRLRIDLDQHRASIDGRLVPLTRKEFRLLTALARTPGAVVTKDRLMAEVWNTSARGRSRTLDSHVTTLRTKIGTAATVENVRGVGYRIQEAVE
jgi:DNA-binding response OmpR family regulator